jgi:hypothetical protein
MKTPMLLGDVLIEVKKGIGKEWAKYPVLGATRDGVAPAKELPGKHPERYKPVTAGTVFYNPMRILIGSIAGFTTGFDPQWVIAVFDPSLVVPCENVCCSIVLPKGRLNFPTTTHR